MRPVPREFASAADIITHARDVRERFRALPPWRQPEPPAGPPPSPPEPISPPVVVPTSPLEFVWQPARAPRILDMVAQKYDLTRAEIQGKCRRKIYTKPRHIVMYLCVRYAGMSFPQTAKLLGGRDHSTVCHGVQKLTHHIAQNTALAAEVAEFVRAIESWSHPLAETGG